MVDRDLETYEKTDSNFHKTLVELTGNKILIEMHRDIMDQLRYMFFIVVWSSEKIKKHEIMDLSKIPIAHKKIYDAILKDDLVLALDLLRHHLGMSVQRYNKIIEIRGLDKNKYFEE